MSTPRRLAALISAPLLVPLVAVTTSASSADAADDGALFHSLSGFTVSAQADDVRVRPDSYTAYRLDLAGLRAQLAGAGEHSVDVPDPDGRLVTFVVREDSVMAPSLQARHPEIRTYSGTATDGSGRSIALDVTPMEIGRASCREREENAGVEV